MFLISFSILLFETLSGIFLYLSVPYDLYRQFVILAHILGGFLFLLPLFLFLAFHLRKGEESSRASLKWIGLGLLLLLFPCLATGIHWTLVGAVKEGRWIHETHLLTGVLFLIPLALHLALGFRKKGEGGKKILVALFLGAMPMVLLYWGAGSSEMVHEVSAEPEVDVPYSYKLGKNPFYPSEATTVTGGFLKEGTLGNSRSCGKSGCHREIYEEWYASAHRWAASDVFYRKTVEEMARDKGVEAVRYCGGCHDPGTLLSGRMTPGGGLFSEVSKEGVSCVVCHSVSKIRHLEGSGAYEYAPPEKYLFEDKTGFPYEQLSALLIRTDPSKHRATYSKEFYGSSPYCSGCHKQIVGKAVNHRGPVKLQDPYGGWLKSPFAGGKNPDSSHGDGGVRSCKDCHMAPVGAEDFTESGEGKRLSHRFVAANTMIPFLRGDKEQLDRTVRRLKQRLIYLSIYPPREKEGVRGEIFVDRSIYHSAETPPYVYMGDEVEIPLVVTNAKVGHNFPEGTTDFQEVWIEIKVTDGQGRTVFHGGSMDEKGFVDPASRFYGKVAVDRKGKVIRLHNIWDMVGIVYEKTIPSGQSDVALYRFKVPYWVKGNLNIMARLRYRKSNQYYTNWVLERKDIRLPVVDMARDTVVLKVKKKRERV